MHRLLTFLLIIGLVASACGGGDGGGDDVAANPDTAATTTPAPTASTDSTDEGAADDAPPTSEDDEPADDEPASGGGGSSNQGLVESLGLPECPVGAHLDVDGPVEIEIWHPFTALTAEAIDDIAAAFNASQSDIIVNVEAQGSYGELLADYRESISFDSLPAIAITDLAAFREMVDSETVLPAQSCVEADGFDLDAIDEQVRASYSVDGALYPAAMNVSSPVLYYNRDHFIAAGLDPDVPPTTLAEMQSAAQALKDAGVAETPLSFLMSGWYVELWLTGAGVPLVNADNGRSDVATEATFNGPEALEIYTTLKEMNDAGLMLVVSNVPGQLSQFLAMTGPASMLLETSTASTTMAGVLGGTANLSELVEQAGIDGSIVGATDLSINIDAAPLPGLDEPGRVFLSGGGFYMTNTGSDAEQAAAWEFMKFVNEVEQQKIMHLKGSYLPINPAVRDDPEVQSVWQNDAAGQWLATAYGQIAGIDPDFPGPVIGPFTEQREAFSESLERVLLGGEDPAAVLADTEATLNEALEDYADANF